MGHRSGLRPRLARAPVRAAGAARSEVREEGAGALHQPDGVHALGQDQAAVAVPPDRTLRHRLRAGGAHPPQLCRWHRAGAGAAVADRHQPQAGRRQGPAIGVAEKGRGRGRPPRRRHRSLRADRRKDAGQGHGDDAGPHAGHDAGEGGRRDRPRTAARAVPVRRPPHAAARQAGRQQARGLGRAAGPGRREGGRPRLRLHRQRRADGRGRRRTAQLHAGAWRAARRGDPARHRAGEPAPAGARAQAGQPLRPGVPGPAGGRRQSDPPAGARGRLHA